MADPPVLLLGASTRAAAWSALRAGLAPLAIDRFGDLDLRSIARVEVADDWDSDASVLSAADRLPPAPWLYTGPIENRPGLVDLLGRRRDLWGNPPDVLRAVRDPVLVAETFRAADLPFAAVRESTARLPADGSWLAKPRASGGGFGIAPWTGREPRDPGACYFQEFVPGTSHSALFLAGESSVRLLGVTLQLLGGGGSRFAYRGGIGPLPVSKGSTRELLRLGSLLVGRFGLLGLFGVDYIDRHGVPCPIEVNPRYTASAELIELATGESILSAHLRMFDPGAGGRVAAESREPLVLGKRILFARRPLQIPRDQDWSAWGLHGPWRVPELADLPEPGSVVATGDPVLTVFASGLDVTDCRRNLDAAAGRWIRSLGEWSI